MKLSTIIIGLMLLSGMVVGTYSFVTGLGTATGSAVVVSQEYVQDFNNTVTLNDELAQKYSKVQNLSAKTGSSFQIITLVPDALSILKDLLTIPFTVMGDIMSAFQDHLGVPGWVFTLVLGIFTVVLIMALLSAILRYEV